MRGVINNRDRKKQIVDYSKIRYGNITPTDLDGIIEYKDKAYIIIEFKYSDAKLPHGQKLALQRLTDDLSKIKPCVCIIARHDKDVEFDIMAHETLVSECRINGMWIDMEMSTKLKDFMDLFIKTLPRY
jgi:hypothetical protein